MVQKPYFLQQLLTEYHVCIRQCIHSNETSAHEELSESVGLDVDDVVLMAHHAIDYLLLGRPLLGEFGV